LPRFREFYFAFAARLCHLSGIAWLSPLEDGLAIGSGIMLTIVRNDPVKPDFGVEIVGTIRAGLT
jgi:hypothetical protein